MKKEDAKKIIVGVLQSVLAGKLRVDVNPLHIADAINQKIDFETGSEERFNREILQTIITSIDDCKKEMEKEYDSLNPNEEKLLRNFVRGKSIAYEEVLDILNQL